MKTDRNLPGATFGHGVSDSVDLTLGFLRSWGDVAVDGRSASDPVSAVFTLSAKWRFYETATSRIAAKPLSGVERPPVRKEGRPRPRTRPLPR